MILVVILFLRTVMLMTGGPSGHPWIAGDPDGKGATPDELSALQRNDPPTVIVLTPADTSARLADVSEFSRDVMEDPWDFSEITDGMLYQQMYDAVIVDGVLTATSYGIDPHFWLLFQGHSSAQNLGKNGQRFPIDPAKYMLASFRMYLSSSSSLYFYWYAGTNGPSGAPYAVSELIPVQAGWHTYRVRLDELGIVQSNGLGEWSSCSVINGLRIDPTVVSGSTIKIDWFRLSEIGDSSTETQVSWIASDDLDNATVSVYFDVDSAGFDGELVWGPESIDNGAQQSASVSTAHLPHPGTYVYVKVDDGVNSPVYQYAPAQAKKNASPLVLILNPNELGSEEFALEVQGNSWDMDGWGDIEALYNVINPEIVDGELRGVSGNDDPQIHPTFLLPINTRRYSSAHIRLWTFYDHFMRLLWAHNSENVEWQTTDDFVLYGNNDVTFKGWNEFVISDMNDLVLENTSTLGWSGEIAGYFRLDPSEAPGIPFALDFVHLYTHDITDSGFYVKWDLVDQDSDVSPVDLAWYWAPSSTSPDSHLIAGLNGVYAGIDSFFWEMSGLESGSYHVFCIANDGLNVTKHSAHGDLILNHKPSFVFTEPDGDDAVNAGRDFAHEVIGDDWDMAQQGDIDEIHGFDTGSISWDDEMFCGLTDQSDVYFQWGPLANTIDAEIFHTLSFRLYLNETTNIQIYWADMDWNWSGITSLPGHSGWNTYVVDLTEHPEWTGSIQVFRLDPTHEVDVSLCIDWVRLTVPESSQFLLEWAALDPDDDAQIQITANDESWEYDEVILIASNINENDGTDVLLWDISAFPPSAYFLTAVINDGINAPIEVVSPFPVVVEGEIQEPVVLHGAMAGADTLLLTWNTPSGAVDRYRIYRSSSTYFAQYFLRPLAETTSTSYPAHLGPAFENPDLNYFFRVTWVSSSEQESPPSNIVGEIDFLTEVTE